MEQRVSTKSKLRIEKLVLRISFLGGVLFMLIEGIMAYYTKSHSILMDFIFDVTDLIMIGPFLVLIPLLYTPVTEKRPYGFTQVESLFVIVKYSVLLFVTLKMMFDNIACIRAGGYEVDASSVTIFEFFIFLGCLFFYLILAHCSRKYESDSIRAELYIWKLDVYSSIGVTLAFASHFLLQNTKFEWFIPYLDPVVAILMSVLLLIEPVKIICVNLKELVLFAPNKEIMDEIRQVAEVKMMEYPYDMQFLDVIQTGRKTWVEIYVSSKNDSVSITSLKQIRDEVKKELKQKFDQIYVEIIPDIAE